MNIQDQCADCGKEFSSRLCFNKRYSEYHQKTSPTDNVNSAFGNLIEDKDFSDVTLACEDGQQVEAHKVILAASSQFS